jgi:DNA-binding LytR/AlgR family response regulator
MDDIGFIKSKKETTVFLEAHSLMIIMFFSLVFIKPVYMSGLDSLTKFIYILSYSFSYGLSYYLVTHFLIRKSIQSDLKFYFINLFVLTLVAFCLLIAVDTLLHSQLNSKNTLSIMPAPAMSLIYFKPKFIYIGLLTVLNISFLTYLKSLSPIIKLMKFNSKRTPSFVREEASLQQFGNCNLAVEGLNKNEVVNFYSDDFLYAKSEGHYVKLFYLIRQTNGVGPIVRSVLIRSSMIALESGVFSGSAFIIRVHKSYFVNFKHVKSLKVISNSKGGVLTLSMQNVSIPLSKSKLPFVLSFIEVYSPFIYVS